ncbi:MAG: nitric oxide reductase activation protein NorD [Thermodesulfobacteriota bacterium]
MEEWVGKGIDRAIQAFHSRRLKGWHRETTPFCTRQHLTRFSMLAALLIGREVRVVDLKGDPTPRPYRPILHRIAHPALLPDYGFGWSDGETIFLPVTISDMPTAHKGDELARLLIFSLSAQLKWATLDFVFNPRVRTRLQNDTLLADIFWIIENARLTTLLFREYPGIIEKWEIITGHLITRRPRANILNGPERLVEALLKECLSSVRAGTSNATTPEESLKAADAIKEQWQSEGAPLKRYRGMVPFPVWGRLIPERIKSSTDDTVARNGKTPESGGSSEKQQEGEGSEEESSRYLVERREVDEEKNEQGLALNIYDKIISWAQFVNVERPFDDDPDDDADKKADQMEELTTAQVARKSNASINADLEKESYGREEDTGAKESAEVFTYPEWDYRKKRYEEDYSRLTETTFDHLKGDFVNAVLSKKRGLIRDIRRKFEAMTPALKIVGQQLEGDAIDLDAAVEAMVELKGGRQPDERIYKSYRRSERDISVLFLVDLSMSTDAWVKDRRVIDHEKEALIVLCEAMESLRDRYAIYGFSGKTRKRCSFFQIKGFDEPSDTRVKERIGGLIPYHYTRMGPAVRHATSLLKRETARARLLFLISDGKPNDMDRYEGRYGIEDTRMAIKEAERTGIVPFCLTVDSHAHEYLPRLFGRGNYSVVAGADRLAQTLPDLYAKMIRSL